MCEQIHKGRPTPCETCKVALLEENLETYRVYATCSTQVVMAGDRVVGLSIPAIKTVMDLYGVEDQGACLGRVLGLFRALQEGDAE